jgi:hypothetical protein
MSIQRVFDPSKRLPIVCNKVNKTITVGTFRADIPQLLRVKETILDTKYRILLANGIDIRDQINLRKDPCNSHALIAEYLGPRFNGFYAYLHYDMWVRDHQELISQFCRNQATFDDNLVFRFHYFKRFIDGLGQHEHHLIPAVLFFGASIDSIRSKLPRHLWITIYRNSKSRNHLIFRFLHSFSKECIRVNKVDQPVAKTHRVSAWAARLAAALQFPTCFLKHVPIYEMFGIDDGGAMISWVAQQARQAKKVSDSHFVYGCARLWRDTKRLAEQLNQPFNPAWSYRRINTEHRRMSRDILTLEFSDTPFVFTVPWDSPVVLNGVTSKLLASPLMVAIEGAEMNHCVAGYVPDVSAGRSILYSLTSAVGERSTLELGWTGQFLRVVQHQGPWNDPISEELMQAGQDLADHLNRQLLLQRKAS